MELSSYFPFWDTLTPSQKQKLTYGAKRRRIKKGTVLHSSSQDCMGLLLISSGQLRPFLLSEEGREITLYRLLDGDICLFSASCILSGNPFPMAIEAEKDTEFWVLPPQLYKSLMEQSAKGANYINEILSSRFSEVMWLLEQILWKAMDKRLASFLLEESALEKSLTLHLTHEKIASHLGTAREVVTRMLRYFQAEGMVSLSRKAVEITDKASLEKLSV